jgi:transketolase
MREVLSKFLSTRALEDRKFFVLSGDHGYALFDEINQKAPKQFINTGVNEQAMVGLAAGMAKTGKKIVVYGLASFIPIRVLEFIKIDICYENLPVIILGDGAGTVYTTLGASHQCTEDIACLRTLPIKIYSPADKFEMELTLAEAINNEMPSYIRIGKSDRPIIPRSPNITKLSETIPIYNHDSKTCILTTGSMLHTGFQLAQKHRFALYSCPILNLYEIENFIQTLKKYQSVITIEEHSVRGGLGEIIANIIAENHLNIKFIKFGIREYFTRGCGSYDYALKYHHLDFHSIESELFAKGYISNL